MSSYSTTVRFGFGREYVFLESLDVQLAHLYIELSDPDQGPMA